MAGPTSPGTEGPTYAPPHLPSGWIAQWDGGSKKYYYVQLSTGVSQWEIPTEAIPTGSTPGQNVEHPYGTPQPELITHPDGSQTRKHADGTMEPVMPMDGSRGMGGSSDRGFGNIAVNALLGGKQSGHSGGQGNPLALAGQLLGGGHSSGHGGGKNSVGGKLVGQLASNLFSSGNKPPQPQNYHGGSSQHSAPHAGGGLAGAVLGGVSSFLGGKPGEGHGGQNYGYSNVGQGGTYTGQAPPAQYQGPPSAPPTSGPPTTGAAASYHSQSYAPPSGPPPPGQYPPPSSAYPSHGAPPGQPNYNAPQHHPYGAPSSDPNHHQPPYGGYNSQFGAAPAPGHPSSHPPYQGQHAYPGSMGPPPGQYGAPRY